MAFKSVYIPVTIYDLTLAEFSMKELDELDAIQLRNSEIGLSVWIDKSVLANLIFPQEEEQDETLS